MRQAWHEFLIANGATLTNGTVTFATDESDLSTLTNHDAICYLQDTAFLRVDGPESGKFLQGQLSCNLDEATSTHSLLGSYCTPKGRMVSTFRLAKYDPETILLGMYQDTVELSEKVLAKYIVFSKATLHSDFQNRIALGLWGPTIGDRLRELNLELPRQQNDMAVQADESRLIQVDSEGQRFEWWLDAADAVAYWQKLCDKCQTRNASDWQLLNIRAGVANVEANTSEMFIPQMLNFQITGAVSFNKGCYTGQEIVARMQYLGKLKRRMYRALITSCEPVIAGQPITLDDNDQPVGNVVSSVRLDAGTVEALVVLTEEGAVHNNTHLQSNSDAKLQLLPLPYAINNET